MKVFKAVAVVFIVCLFAGMDSAAWAQTKTAPQKSPAAPKKAAPAAYDAALLQPAALVSKAPDVYEVKFVTTKGDFTVKVTRAWAPLGADRFYNLVKHGFYNGASFFRVLPGFVAQFGFHANPKVSAVWQNTNIKDDVVKETNRKGTLTFATGGPNTRTTQVFINYGNNARLDAMGFSPFGEVTEGMNIVEQLYGDYGDGPEQGGRGPSQGKIAVRGSAYLEKEFPKLDSIKSATLVSTGEPQSPAPAKKAPAKKAPAPAKKTP